MYLKDKLPEAPVETKPIWVEKPFELASLVAWLRTMPNAKYDYWCDKCLIGQYLTAAQIKFTGICSRGWNDNSGFHDFPSQDWNNLAIGYPRTFGAALQRAEALLFQSAQTGAPNRAIMRKR